MSENAIGRRQALRGAGIAAGGVAVAGLATATPAEAAGSNSVLGSWLCVHQDTGSRERIRTILSPTLRVQLWGSVSRDKLVASYRFTVFAPNSTTQVIDSGTGKVSGRRLPA